MLWLVIILVIFVIWAIFAIISRGNKIKHLIQIGSSVLTHLKYDIPNYQIRESTNGQSRTIFSSNDIPLVEIQMRNKDGKYFDQQTLYVVYLHEMTHVLFPTQGHSSIFYQQEDRLLQAAIELGYISEKIPVDSSYPTSVV